MGKTAEYCSRDTGRGSDNVLICLHAYMLIFFSEHHREITSSD